MGLEGWGAHEAFRQNLDLAAARWRRKTVGEKPWNNHGKIMVKPWNTTLRTFFVTQITKQGKHYEALKHFLESKWLHWWYSLIHAWFVGWNCECFLGFAKNQGHKEKSSHWVSPLVNQPSANGSRSPQVNVSPSNKTYPMNPIVEPVVSNNLLKCSKLQEKNKFKYVLIPYWFRIDCLKHHIC